MYSECRARYPLGKAIYTLKVKRWRRTNLQGKERANLLIGCMQRPFYLWPKNLKRYKPTIPADSLSTHTHTSPFWWLAIYVISIVCPNYLIVLVHHTWSKFALPYLVDFPNQIKKWNKRLGLNIHWLLLGPPITNCNGLLSMYHVLAQSIQSCTFQLHDLHMIPTSVSVWQTRNNNKSIQIIEISSNSTWLMVGSWLFCIHTFHIQYVLVHA